MAGTSVRALAGSSILIRTTLFSLLRLLLYSLQTQLISEKASSCSVIIAIKHGSGAKKHKMKTPPTLGLLRISLYVTQRATLWRAINT